MLVLVVINARIKKPLSFGYDHKIVATKSHSTGVRGNVILLLSSGVMLSGNCLPFNAFAGPPFAGHAAGSSFVNG